MTCFVEFHFSQINELHSVIQYSHSHTLTLSTQCLCVCVCAHWKCVQLIESISFNYRSCNVRNFVGKSIFEAQMASLNDTIQLSNFSLCCVLLFWRDINEIQIMRYQSNRIIVAPTTTTTYDNNYNHDERCYQWKQNIWPVFHSLKNGQCKRTTTQKQHQEKPPTILQSAIEWTSIDLWANSVFLPNLTGFFSKLIEFELIRVDLKISDFPRGVKYSPWFWKSQNTIKISHVYLLEVHSNRHQIKSVRKHKLVRPCSDVCKT